MQPTRRLTASLLRKLRCVLARAESAEVQRCARRRSMSHSTQVVWEQGTDPPQLLAAALPFLVDRILDPAITGTTLHRSADSPAQIPPPLSSFYSPSLRSPR